jgi:chaperonin GroEL
MAKSVTYDDEARAALERGIDVLADAVAVTLGPKGRNVVLGQKFGAPKIVNDGFTIAKEIELEDHIENTGVSLIRQVAAKTNDFVGDGTTTAVVLGRAIIQEGLRNVAAGANPMAIRRGIDRATQTMLELITERAQPVKDTQTITQVGTIAAGNDPMIGRMIAQAMEEVGEAGTVSLEDGNSIHTEVEVTEGMRFDRGYISPYFVTDNERMETLLEDAYVLVTEQKITRVQDLVSILEQVAQSRKPLLIIAEDIVQEALAALVLNRLQGVLQVAAVKAPGFGDRRAAILQDIAVLTGGNVISSETGHQLDQVKLDLLGQARRIVITKDHTTLVAEGNDQAVKARCEQIRHQIEETTSDYDREKLEERLAKLTGGVAVIKVGAATETEMKERKLKLEDAINATRAAVEQGIVPGGGTTYVHLIPALEAWCAEHLTGDELIGAMIVARALEAPLRRIAVNAGQNGALVVSRLKEQPFSTGYDASTGQIVDLFEAGIVDPAKVTCSALQNAASIAEMVLTTECIITEQPQPPTPSASSTG